MINLCEQRAIKLNLLLYFLYYAEAYITNLGDPSPCQCAWGNTTPFEEMLKRWRAVGNTVSNLISPRFEQQTSHSRDKRNTAQSLSLHNYSQEKQNS